MHRSSLDGGTNENAVSPLSALCAIFRVKLPFSDKIKETLTMSWYYNYLFFKESLVHDIFSYNPTI